VVASAVQWALSRQRAPHLGHDVLVQAVQLAEELKLLAGRVQVGEARRRERKEVLAAVVELALALPQLVLVLVALQALHGVLR
jgi:hypothetical protein